MIRQLPEQANVLPQNSTRVMISSSSDLSIESLRKNLRPTSNTASIPSASSSSSIDAGKQREDDHAQFTQAVQAIVTSDEAQSTASSSRIHIEDDQRSHGNTSNDINREKTFLINMKVIHRKTVINPWKFSSHGSLLLNNRQFQSNLFPYIIFTDVSFDLDDILPEVVPSYTQQANPPLIIDDIVDDVPSSISSLSVHTPVDNSQELNRHENDQNRFLEEKRLIEGKLQMIRRERESFLHEHEKCRQLMITV